MLQHCNRSLMSSQVFLMVLLICINLSLCVSGVDDSESECGLDGGVQFDWIINNDADGASLEEQLQPLLKLALESGDRH